MIDIIISNDLIVNIMIHITILFIFLYFFFFLIISKKAETTLNKNIDNICDNNLPGLLKDLDEKYGNKIDWKKLKENCQYIHDHTNDNITNHINDTNNKYKKIGIYIATGLLLLTILTFCYFVFYKKETIDIKSILIENGITFLLIGIIEYIFFMIIASNYIPAYPTKIGEITLERIKENIKNI